MVKYFLGEVDPSKPNISEGFEEKLPKVVDYFAKVYGEKYRKQFSEKLNNCTYIFMNRPRNEIRFSNGAIYRNLSDYAKKQWNIKYISDTAYYKYWDRLIHLDRYKKVDYDCYLEQLKFFYSTLSLENEFGGFDEFIASKKFDVYIDKIKNEIRPFVLMMRCMYTHSFDKLGTEYNEILTDYFCYYNDLDLDVDIDTRKSYYKFFGDENLLSDEDKFNILNHLKASLSYDSSNLTKQEFENISSYDELMDKLDLRKFKQQAIEVFNFITDLAKSAILESNLGLKKQLEDISNSLSNGDSQTAYKTLNNLFYAYYNSKACALVTQGFNGKVSCFLPQDSPNEVVVHELCHVATSFGPSYALGGEYGLYGMKSGVEIDNQQGTRSGVYLNEAITQRGALIIDEMMQQDGVFIGTNNTTGRCGYNCLAGLVNEFIESFDELLKTYNGSSHRELVYQIGGKNYDRLDDCFTRIFNLTKHFTLDEVDETIEYWQRIMHPETKHPFVRDMTHVNIAATVKNPSNEVMKEIKNLKNIYDDIVAYQKNAGTQI